MSELNNDSKSVADNESPAKLTSKKQWVWSGLFIIIAVVSVWAVVNQAKEFSISGFIDFFGSASPLWIFAAFLSMLGFIVFEGAALLCFCKAFGYKQSFGRGLIYSASDIYFSAITPSASGGQPASAYFMMKNGIPGMLTTVSLVANLAMYILAILVIGLLCFLIYPQIFLGFDGVSKTLIIAGSITQLLLGFFIIMLLIKKELLHSIIRFLLHIICKLKILRREEERQEKLSLYMESYHQYAHMLSGHTKTLLKAFLLNFLQRLAQISVTLFTYLAAGGSLSNSGKLLAMQGYVTLGSNFVPVPGAMGVSDYLMLDGFGNIMDESAAVNLELLSRSFSFYICVFLCGVITLVGYRLVTRKDKKKGI